MKASPSLRFLPALALGCVLACAGCATTGEAPPDAASAPSEGAATQAESAVPPSPAVPAEPSPAPLPEASTPTMPESLGADELAKAVTSYDDGNYAAAVKQFQAALALGLLQPGEQSMAHKHLAFMACVARRTSTCRAEFRKALAADPGFELAPAEAGHPTWGPVYRRVKAEVSKAKPR